MSQNHENKQRVYSMLSDEQLAGMLAREKEAHPYEFTSSDGVSGIKDSASFLASTSGRAIEPMRKWL